MWLVSSLYLQQVLGLSPLHTGLIFLPMTIVIAVVASRAGKLVTRFGVRPVLGGGLMMLTVGMLLLARIGSSGNGLIYIAIPGLLAAAGIAMSIVPSTIAATQGAKEGQAGLASGLVNTSRQVGGGLGLAILLILATQRSSQLIGAGETVNQSLTEGFRLAFLIGAGLAAVAMLMTFIALPRTRAGAAPGRPSRDGWLRGARRGLCRVYDRLRELPRGADRGLRDLGRHDPELRHRALAAPAEDQADRLGRLGASSRRGTSS